MSLDRAALAALLEDHGAVTRVLVAEARGSAPREAGAAMLVWAEGFSGTIGGGALEWQALATARDVLAVQDAPRVMRLALGPALGQCCGGAVTLVFEPIREVPPDPWLRRVEGDLPAPAPGFRGVRDGWLYEEGSVAQPLWVWGAGHVGRAVVSVMEAVPDYAITWVDTDAGRFPEHRDGPARLVAAEPARAMAHAPDRACHLILTHSHEIDLALCHAALIRGFDWCGLIGSQTKWARFRSRLAALGHMPAEIDRITCPIGDPALGKHPQAIAVGVAAGLLSRRGSGDG